MGKNGENMSSSRQSRFRNNAGRLLLELLYGEADWIERGGGTVKYALTKFSTEVQMRPSRQIDCLTWLADRGLINHLSIGRTHVTMELVNPLGFVASGERLEPSEFAPALGGVLPWQA